MNLIKLLRKEFHMDNIDNTGNDDIQAQADKAAVDASGQFHLQRLSNDRASLHNEILKLSAEAMALEKRTGYLMRRRWCGIR